MYYNNVATSHIICNSKLTIRQKTHKELRTSSLSNYYEKKNIKCSKYNFLEAFLDDHISFINHSR